MGYLLVALLALAALLLWQVVPLVIQSIRSPLRHLPGPPSAHWFFGNFKMIMEGDISSVQERWTDEYGPTIAYRGAFRFYRLWTMDTRALNHIITHSADYQKPSGTRNILGRLLGTGVLVTEGERHRQQRRIMNPAFGPAQIRELTGIFLEKSLQLRDMWASKISSSQEGSPIDVTIGFSQMTLDVIGLAGFSYKFGALGDADHPSELLSALRVIFNANGQKIEWFPMLQGFIPALRIIPTKSGQRIKQAQKVMRRIGRQLIAEKKAAILSQTSSMDGTRDPEKTSVSRMDMQGRDLLTLLMKANMATDIPENQKLSEEDVLAQIPTFFVAGHETTATAASWCLYALTQAPDVQTKLRAELRSVNTDIPDMDELVALPYLDAVVRETLRLHAPVPSTLRIATKDDLIPLQEPVTDRNGNTYDHIKISKGDLIIIPLLAMNRSKHLWGEDALEFKPERWEKPPEAIASVPGVWGNMMTFLGGPRACIGYRFSLVEMKALIFTLVRAFEFELGVPPEDIGRRRTVVTRPYVKSQSEVGNQLPLIIRPVGSS